ncbi:MAG: AzlC family ABC transporter permease [Clostridia bacterium]|nr:AzlC family ABC transporter permease [Clostridia bacterium]
MKRNEFLNGIKDGIPICLGYFSVSMAFGIAAVKGGIPAWAATLTSLTNVTSAGQFAGINIMLALGSLIELAITTLIINMRYFLMSLSVSQKVDSSMKLWQRFLVSFGITDEIFAVSMRHSRPLTAVYMAGLILTPVLGWTSGTAVGAVATKVMPVSLSSAMGIALYGMFIAIIIPPARKNKKVMTAVLASIGASVIFTYAPILKNISSGWAIIIITIIVSAFCATFFPVEEKGDSDI